VFENRHVCVCVSVLSVAVIVATERVVQDSDDMVSDGHSIREHSVSRFQPDSAALSVPALCAQGEETPDEQCEELLGQCVH
jgi:hypothetical protein